MYVHTPFPNNVFALDLNNGGAIKWSYKPKQDYDETVDHMCCDTVNRGLVYADGKIFLNQADTTLVAVGGVGMYTQVTLICSSPCFVIPMKNVSGTHLTPVVLEALST